MDGVIFEGNNFWLELHRCYGTEKEGVEYANKYLSFDYDQLVKIVAGILWKGKPAAIIQELVDQRRYQPGIPEIFEFLHKNNIWTAIVSSGPYELALRAQRDFGIHTIRANRLVVENGVIQGEVEVMVPDAEKARVGREVMSQFGAARSQTAFIGDSDPDVELAKSVDVSIAYNSHSKRLLEVCNYSLEYGELYKLPRIIRDCLDSPEIGQG